jgi:zinc transport system substrate-binding protein
MVYHPSWGYFSDTYKLRQIAIEEEGKKPGPAGVAAIIEQARNENISVIFVSPQFDTSSAETIANEINGEVSSVNPLMSDYSKTLQNFTESLVNGYSES